MVKHIVSLFILLSYFISGCEDSTVNTKMTKNPQMVTKEQSQSKEATKKKPALYEQTKKIVKRKPPLSKIEKISDLTDPPHNQQTLDLSIPQTSEIRIAPATSDKTLNNEQREYLPDLFSDKKNQKNDTTVEIEGKIIKKKEVESEKQRTVDGVGIGIKLTP